MREGFRRQRRQDHANASRQGKIRIAALESRHGVVDRYQGRGAGGVNGDRRSFEAQREGDPSGRGAETVAGDQI
ncbi:MAG: hypothetical protein OXH76_24055, partial [Boseongicola sp.]|nr:hypothetical protein [Boseongicola sp.]